MSPVCLQCTGPSGQSNEMADAGAMENKAVRGHHLQVEMVYVLLGAGLDLHELQ